jgi:hypothetical protein
MSATILDDEFKLMFLRTEVFDTTRGERYALYRENRVDLLGPTKAFLHMTLDGAMKDDLEALSYGYICAVPSQEGVLLIDPSRTGSTKEIDIESITRACFYMMTKALEASDQLQRTGVVSVVDLGQVKPFDYHLLKLISETFKDGFPTRSSICLIVKPPPLVGPVISIFKSFSEA